MGDTFIRGSCKNYLNSFIKRVYVHIHIYIYIIYIYIFLCFFLLNTESQSKLDMSEGWEIYIIQLILLVRCTGLTSTFFKKYIYIMYIYMCVYVYLYVPLLYKIYSLLKNQLRLFSKKHTKSKMVSPRGLIAARSVSAEKISLVEVIKFYLQIKAISLITFVFFFYTCILASLILFLVSFFHFLFYLTRTRSHILPTRYYEPQYSM